MRSFLILWLAFICLFPTVEAQHRCHTDAYHAEQLQDAGFAENFKNVSNQIYNQDLVELSCNNPILVPVAVHFGANIDNSNPACLLDKIDEQLRVLNDDFAGINQEVADYKNLAAQCGANFPLSALGTGSCIQFILASKDHPSCEPAGNLIDNKAITIGKHAWPTAPCWSGYLNIFVIDTFSQLGLAPLAGGANPNGNGILVHASAFGGKNSSCTSGAALDNYINYGLGRTVTHEVGHYFGLKHIFDGCGSGDSVADTPSQSDFNLNCPTVDPNTCSSNANNSCSTQDFFFNFLDYVDDPCMWMFTEGQNQVMHNTAMLGTFKTTSIEPELTYKINFLDKSENLIAAPTGTQILLKSSTDPNINIDLSSYLNDGILSYPVSNLSGIDQPYLSFYNNESNLLQNSLTAIDLVLIQKHILNLQPFTNPYVLLASDVNASQTTSAIDIISIRKVILGLNTSFPKDVFHFYIQECGDCQQLQLSNAANVLSELNVVVVKTGNVN